MEGRCAAGLPKYLADLVPKGTSFQRLDIFYYHRYFEVVASWITTKLWSAQGRSRGPNANRSSVFSMSRSQSAAGVESNAKLSPWSKMCQLPRAISFCSCGMLQPH